MSSSSTKTQSWNVWSGAAVAEAGEFLINGPLIVPSVIANKWLFNSNRYKNGKIDGTVTGPWCGSTWHFNEVLKTPRWEDYEMRYTSRNRFTYMGNGRTGGELRGDDMATHLRQPGA